MKRDRRSGDRALITGATGMVGRTVVAAARRARLDVGTITRRAVVADPSRCFSWDLSREAPPAALEAWGPRYIIHAAAKTDVDSCEADPASARQVNVDGTRRVASLAEACGARLVYLSTDSVFDGSHKGCYEDTDDPNPLNVYAATKREGELAVLAVPGSVVIRFNVVGPAGLSWWILQSAARQVPIPVYSDVRFNPLEVRDLASAIVTLTTSGVTGVCHLAGDEVVSKADFARRLVAAAGLSSGAVLLPICLATHQRGAVRPLDTSLRMSDRVRGMVAVSSLDDAIQRLANEFVIDNASVTR